ncbi:MAG: heme NO-binding domain-containing protein [Ktedonobacteraceae bacterium]|nr:heme NO-binding domain-containing protein [Chloroflexota bacterium]
MHGLIFVTWEKYLSERFGGTALQEYRTAIGETFATTPLANRVYDDAALLAGVAAANRITGAPVDTLLREYGRYFITNGLTRYRCAYLLSQVHSGRDLLLAMRDAHKQMSRIPDGLTPPVFQYRALPHNTNGLLLIYDSPRKLCVLLLGAIEGAAEYYHEKVAIVEHLCMKRGDRACTLEVIFSAPLAEQLAEIPEVRERHLAQRQFADLILSVLPFEKGLTLADLQGVLQMRGLNAQQHRPALILQALEHLHHAGLVANTANQPGDVFTHRQYWRVPTS